MHKHYLDGSGGLQLPSPLDASGDVAALVAVLTRLELLPFVVIWSALRPSAGEGEIGLCLQHV